MHCGVLFCVVRKRVSKVLLDNLASPCACFSCCRMQEVIEVLQDVWDQEDYF